MAYQQVNRNKPKKGKLPSIKTYLAADMPYQNTVADLEESWGRYKEGRGEALSRIRGVWNKRQKRFVGGDYLNSLQAMQQQKRRDIRDIKADYAARGLGTSGLIGQATDQYGMDWLQAKQDLQESRKRGVEDIWAASEDQKAILAQQRRNARMDAIRRRIAEYGLRG